MVALLLTGKKLNSRTSPTAAVTVSGVKTTLPREMRIVFAAAAAGIGYMYDANMKAVKRVSGGGGVAFSMVSNRLLFFLKLVLVWVGKVCLSVGCGRKRT